MKKTFKNAIFTCLFALCCVFGFFTCSFMSIQTNAIENENQEEVVENEEEKEYETYFYNDGVMTGELKLYDDFTFEMTFIEEEKVYTANGTYVIEENCVVITYDNESYDIFLDKTNNTFKDYKEEVEVEKNENQEEIETEEPDVSVEEEKQEITKEELTEEIKDKLVEIKDWIIALIASFLGTSGLVAFVKVLLNKWFNTQQTNLKAKLDQMEQEKKIAVEQKEVILEQFNKLTNQFNQVLEYNEKLCEYISSKIKADEEKVFKTNQLLQALLPVLEEEKSDVDEK